MTRSLLLLERGWPSSTLEDSGTGQKMQPNAQIQARLRSGRRGPGGACARVDACVRRAHAVEASAKEKNWSNPIFSVDVLPERMFFSFTLFLTRTAVLYSPQTITKRWLLTRFAILATSKPTPVSTCKKAAEQPAAFLFSLQNRKSKIVQQSFTLYAQSPLFCVIGESPRDAKTLSVEACGRSTAPFPSYEAGG